MIKKIVFFSICSLVNAHYIMAHQPLQQNHITIQTPDENELSQDQGYDELDRLADQIPEQQQEEPNIFKDFTKKCFGYLLIKYFVAQNYCKKSWNALVKLLA